MKQTLLILLAFIVLQKTFAQQKITIVDSISKIGLQGVTINVNNKNYTTNKKGQFSTEGINLPFTVIISYVGYNSKQFQITTTNKVDTIVLSLSIKAKEIAKVIAKKPLLTMGTGKITMNIAASGLSIGSHSWEILTTAPGVKTTDDGSITLLGKSVTVYIDGRSTNASGDQLKSILSSLPAGSVERIELISNPSAKYQANGAAVINIVTNKIRKEGTNGTLTSSLGTSRYFRTTQSLDLNYRKNKINIYGGVNCGKYGNISISKSDRVITGQANTLYAYEPLTSITKQQSYGVKLGMDYDISKKTTVGFLVNGYNANRNKNGDSYSYITFTKNQYDSTVWSNIVNKSQFNTPSVNIFLRSNIDSAKELITNFDYYKYDQQWKENFTISFLGNTINAKPPQYRRDNSPTTLNIYSNTTDYTQTLKNGNLQAGFKLNYITTDNNINWELLNGGNWQNDALRTNYFIYKENVTAAYAGFNKTIKKVALEAILRAEHTNIKGNSITLNNVFTKNYTNFFPSLSVVNNVNNKNQISFSYRKSIDRPSYQNVNPFKLFRSQFSYFEGNPNLDPTYTHSIELQHSYKSAFFTSIVYSYIDQFTGSIPTQDTATRIITYKYANYTDAKQIALNLNYNKQVKPYWYTATNASLSYFKAAYPGITPKQSTPIVEASSYNIFTLKKSKLRLELYTYLSLPFHDGFYHHGLNSNCNIAVSKPVLKNKATLRLNVTNVFGINNVENRTEIGNVYMATRIFRDSRSANIAFTYRFGNKNVKQAKQRGSKISKETSRMGN
jgi:hypothetical protein